MSAQAVATTGLTLGVGVFMGWTMGASLKKSLVFVATDLSVCLALYYLPFYSTFHATKILAGQILGCIAGGTVIHTFFEKKEFGWPEAVGTHLLTIIMTAWTIYFFVPPLMPPEQV